MLYGIHIRAHGWPRNRSDGFALEVGGDEGLETQKYSLYPQEHPANCSLRWRLSNGLGCISHDCKLDLVTIQGNLTGDQYIRDVLQPVLLPTDKRFAQEVPEPAYDGLTCLKYALWDSNPGSWLAKEQKSRLRFGAKHVGDTPCTEL
jgi:hypothetical protein